MRKSMSSEEQTWLWKMTAAVMFTLAAKDEQVLTAIRKLAAEIGEGDYAERVLIPMATSPNKIGWRSSKIGHKDQYTSLGSITFRGSLS